MVSTRKLTDEQVREIKRSRESARALAERYGVSHPTILNVRDGNTYAHVTDDGDDPVVGDLHNAFVFADGLDFLHALPDGYCRTVVTSPPEPDLPPSVRQREARGADVRRSHQGFLHEQREVILQCIRVAGDQGIVLYHYRPQFTMGRLDMGHDLTDGLPLHRIIIWRYKKQRLSAGTRKNRRLPNTYDMIFMFTGRHWSLPEENSEDMLEWGDVWEIELDREGRRFTPGLPNELVDRCVALGRGRVLDPYAGSGATVLAAVRAGRNWLACDTDPEQINTFHQRHGILEQYDRYFH